MKYVIPIALAALVSLAAVGCREEGNLMVLFTGDERGWITPAG